MSSTTRTFVAVEVPPDCAERLGRLQQRLAGSVPSARWVEPSQMHLTLAFLGDVPHADLSGLCKAIGQAASPFSRFDLEIAGLGAFPDPSRPRVLWIGLRGESLDRLMELQRSVAAATAEAGYPPDDKSFHPHITLARFKPGRGGPADLTAIVEKHRVLSIGRLPVAEVVAFSSNLTREGPEYASLARSRLLGRKVESRP